MEPFEAFLETLDEYLILNDLNVTGFARRANLFPQTVSSWRKGNSYPALASLIKIADLFNCSLDYLLGRAADEAYFPSLEKPTFFKRLNALISKSGFTCYQISKMCKLNNGNFSSWKEKTVPKPETLVKLADFFNVSLDYLIGRSDSV